VGRYILHTMVRKMVKCIDCSLVTNEETKYFHFNKNASADPYYMLFHDANLVSGLYEPLLYKKLARCNIEQPDTCLSPMCKNLEYYWKCNMEKMHYYGLSKAIYVVSSCNDSLFKTLYYLIAT